MIDSQGQQGTLLIFIVYSWRPNNPIFSYLKGQVDQEDWADWVDQVGQVEWVYTVNKVDKVFWECIVEKIYKT